MKTIAQLTAVCTGIAISEWVWLLIDGGEYQMSKVFFMCGGAAIYCAVSAMNGWTSK